jgi:hypothetical protein
VDVHHENGLSPVSNIVVFLHGPRVGEDVNAQTSIPSALI